jgi:hypothetical protein
MKTHVPAREGTPPALQIHQPPEVEATAEEIVELDDQRQHLEEQTRKEDFWAGRNLGNRKSARIAA